MKVKILSLDKYTKENRDIKIGKVYKVHVKSNRLSYIPAGNRMYTKEITDSFCYLIEDKKKRPITMYSHQVEEMN